MLRHALFMALLLSSGCGHAGNFLIEPAPEPSGKGESLERFFIVPFKDARKSRDLYTGRSEWDAVFVDAAGSTSLAGVWQALKPGDLSYLWHRQLGSGLSGMGYFVTAAEIPLPEYEQGALALESCNSLIMDGEVKKLFIDKRGADSILGTNVTGTKYNFKSEAKVRVRSAETGKVLLNKDYIFTHTFLNKKMMGAENKDTFPIYFVTGLEKAVSAIGEDSELRILAGLPTVTPTPTATKTPEPASPDKAAPVQAAATPTPAPTPDMAPYWVNPKTGKRMDPSWKFDPEDGTPASKFILRSPSKGK